MLSFSFQDDVLLRDGGFDNSCFGFLFIRNHVPLGSLPALLQLHCAVLLRELLAIGSSKNLFQVLTC